MKEDKTMSNNLQTFTKGLIKENPILVLLLGCIREFLGSGSIFGLTILPETANILVFILPPGAFICLGFVIAIVNKLKKESH